MPDAINCLQLMPRRGINLVYLLAINRPSQSQKSQFHTQLTAVAQDNVVKAIAASYGKRPEIDPSPY